MAPTTHDAGAARAADGRRGGTRRDGGTRIGLKIGELARAAGVGRGTVQHYLRLGLLPRPRKSARNMAWYDPACVERIRAIRELRERRFLPLPVIARMVRAGDLRAEALAGLPPPPPDALGADAVERDLGVPRAAQRELRALGLVDPVRRGGREAFAGDDLEVLRAVGDLRRAGFVEQDGFRVRDLAVYRDALARLQQKEARAFRARTGGMPPERAARLARAGAAGGTALIVALRSKLLRRFLQGGEA